MAPFLFRPGEDMTGPPTHQEQEQLTWDPPSPPAGGNQLGWGLVLVVDFAQELSNPPVCIVVRLSSRVPLLPVYFVFWGISPQ